MPRRLFLAFILLVAASMVLLGWMSANVVKTNQIIAKESLANLLSSQLYDADRLITQLFESYAERLTSELDSGEPDFEMLRRLRRKIPIVRQGIYVDKNGVMLFPPPEDSIGIDARVVAAALPGLVDARPLPLRETDSDTSDDDAPAEENESLLETTGDDASKQQRPLTTEDATQRDESRDGNGEEPSSHPPTASVLSPQSDVVDFSDETAETKSLYGLDQDHCKSFGSQLLAARRLVERGVRFVQIQHGGGGAGAWDAHGGLKKNHTANALAVDQPIGGLLADLERRGLLAETLVVFATEFGRTPGSQGSNGRDHHIFGFTVWMAGGGLKRGVVHGATDEIGFHAVEDRHYVTDIHATILNQLGLESRKLEIPGRKRLDIDHGRPKQEIIA